MVDISAKDLNLERSNIIIKSLAHGDSVSFIPYNFTFDDNFKPDWQEYNSFGRMDPIMIYKKTSRDINISFDVVGEMTLEDFLEATSSGTNANTKIGSVSLGNFAQLQKLIKFLYPVYSEPLSQVSDIKNLKQQLNNVTNQLNTALEVFELNEGQPSEDDAIQIEGLQQLSLEQSKIQNLITQETNAAQQNQAIKNFGIKTIQKSPLFVIKFLNLLNNTQYVCAITSFKHKLFFDEGTMSITKDGQFIPGKFNIALSFKVMHNYLPGTIENY